MKKLKKNSSFEIAKTPATNKFSQNIVSNVSIVEGDENYSNTSVDELIELTKIRIFKLSKCDILDEQANKLFLNNIKALVSLYKIKIQSSSELDLYDDIFKTISSQ